MEPVDEAIEQIARIRLSPHARVLVTGAIAFLFPVAGKALDGYVESLHHGSVIGTILSAVCGAYYAVHKLKADPPK